MSDQNTHLRYLYAPGFSSLRVTYYKTNLVFSFTPYAGKDYQGLDKYSTSKFLSTSVNYDGASFFYQVARQIIDGRTFEIMAKLSCLNNASLLLENKPDKNNQMSTYLSISKNNETIPFKFKVQEYQSRENGRMVTKVIQSGLGTFAMMLQGYLTGIGADLHLSKLSEEDIYNPQC